jgi:hypothetical protein
MGRKPTLVGFGALMGLVGEFDKLPDFPGEFKLPRPVIEDSVPQTMSLMSKYGSGEWLHDNTVRAMRHGGSRSQHAAHSTEAAVPRATCASSQSMTCL